jgi:hypothetical protein
MEKLRDVIAKVGSLQLEGWSFNRIDNGSGFWLKSPTNKAFAIHFKYEQYGKTGMYLEVNDYDFIERTNFQYSDDMDDLIVNHLLEYEKKQTEWEKKNQTA